MDFAARWAIGSSRDDADVARLLERLIAGCAERAFRIAYSLVRDHGEAEDAVQEALARACASARDLRDPSAGDAWFFQIVVNLCMSTLRRRRLRYLAYARWLDDAQDPPAAPAGDVAVALREQAHVALRSLDALPTRQRAVLVLRYGHDMPVAEIASLLRIGPESVKTHLARGLRRLRHAMQRTKGEWR
jgi:RNA polymerase sigma factor (sigma-70 family)